MKNKTTSYIKNKVCWPLFSRYIRLRDCLKTTGRKDMGVCISCGRWVKFNECDAGHYISRKINATFFDERNVNLQCKGCNSFPDGSTFDKYKKELIKRYGEGVIIELEETAKEYKKFTLPELGAFQEYLKEKIKELEI